jgi:predicted Zn-dependent protease
VRALAAIALGALALACAPAPKPTAEREKRTVILDTPAADAAVGEEQNRDVSAQVGIVKNPELERYLQALGEKLVRFSTERPFAYRFQVVDQWSPNAFALPGGYIYVSRGLLVLTNSEDELACVVGHEITHAAARHAAGQQAYMEQLSPFSLGLPRMASVAAYARDQERAADTGGQRICSKAGYDPSAMSTFLQSLDAIERLQMGNSRIPTFLDTHPGTGERIGSAAVFASTLPAPPARDVAALREKYLDHFRGVMLGANPAEGVIQGNRFLHPDLGFGLAFPANWEVVNTPAAVIAIPQKRNARFALEDAGTGDDPQAVAEPYLAKRLAEVQAAIEFKGMQETRCCKTYVVRGSVLTPQGVIAGQLTWVALGGHVYRLSAAYLPIAAGKYADLARQFVRSLHPLTQEERDSVKVDRLELARAKAGETIQELSARTGNVYELHPTAIANGISVDARLTAGQLLKIGIRGPYRPAASQDALPVSRPGS